MDVMTLEDLIEAPEDEFFGSCLFRVFENGVI